MPRKGNATLVGLSAPRVIIVPRWGGTANDEWYPWLASELPGVDVLDLPNPEAPDLDVWTAGVAAAVGDDPYALARTCLIAHSAGCRAALHALTKLPPGRAVNKVLFVAGWWTIDEPWPEIQPWIDAPLDLELVKDGFQSLEVLLSTNDPFTADHEANAAQWREQLDAEVVVVAEAKHFNGIQQPIVLDKARELFAEL